MSASGTESKQTLQTSREHICWYPMSHDVSGILPGFYHVFGLGIRHPTKDPVSGIPFLLLFFYSLYLVFSLKCTLSFEELAGNNIGRCYR